MSAWKAVSEEATGRDIDPLSPEPCQEHRPRLRIGSLGRDDEPELGCSAIR